jgi:hypothetical protein
MLNLSQTFLLTHDDHSFNNTLRQRPSALS